MYSLALSVFSNYFNKSNVWVSLLLIFIMDLVCRQKGRYADANYNEKQYAQT
jgi:hypothetical protein